MCSGADVPSRPHQNARALNHVSQFAHITRPGMLLQQCRGLRSERDMMRTKLRQKAIGQSVEIFHAIAQRRQVDGKDRKAIKEIFTERALPHQSS